MRGLVGVIWTLGCMFFLVGGNWCRILGGVATQPLPEGVMRTFIIMFIAGLVTFVCLASDKPE